MLVRQAPHLQATPDTFFLAPEHEECWARLLFVVEQQRHLALLTGVAEAGKSRLLDAVAAETSRTVSSEIYHVDACGLTSEEFVLQMARAYDGAAEQNSSWTSLEDWLWGMSAAALENRPLWLIDHVDQAIEDVLPCVRRFIRLLEQSGLQASILLCARDWNSVSPMSDLADLWCELPGWEADSTRLYLEKFRPLTQQSIRFSAHAAQAVFDCTQGIAGRVRRLSELCCLAAELREVETVEVDLVLEVYGELISPLAHERRN